MRVAEIQLIRREPLSFKGRALATVEQQLGDDGIDQGLVMRFDSGPELLLPGAIDTSEERSAPRILVIEGTPENAFIIMGGEKIYRLTTSGKFRVLDSLFLRADRDEEYWTIDTIYRNEGIIIVYETGVLRIDEALEVRWHKRKFVNDFFIGLREDFLVLSRDDGPEWSIRLTDGEVFLPSPLPSDFGQVFP